MPDPQSAGCRLFVAIDLPETVAWRLGRLLVGAPRGVRPVRTSQIHLTLHFLGDVEAACRPELRAALARVRHAPFTITISGSGVFPQRGRPSVLWAGVAESAALHGVHAAVGDAIASCGLAVEHRSYVPHVTLARLTPAVPMAWVRGLLAATRALVIDDLPVDRFGLYESRRLDGVTQHARADTFALSG